MSPGSVVIKEWAIYSALFDPCSVVTYYITLYLSSQARVTLIHCLYLSSTPCLMLLYRLSVQCLLCRQMTECLNSSKTISHHDAKIMTSWSINLQRNKDVVCIKNKIGKYLYSLIYELVYVNFVWYVLINKWNKQYWIFLL